MGIVRYFAKGFLVAAFLAASGFSYFIGAQRGNIEDARFSGLSHNEILPSDSIRRDLIAALQSDAAKEVELLSRQLARLKPMSEVPYESALALAFARGDTVGVEQFSAYVMDRQPRSLAARLQYFRSAAIRLDFESLFHHYERLIELRSLNARLLSEALIGVFRELNDWTKLLEYLETNPPSGLFLVSQLSLEMDTPDGFGDLLLKYPSQQGDHLRRVISDQGFESAYALWTLYADLADQTDGSSFLFNGDFQRRIAPPPFNWSIHSIRAELKSSNGLTATFSGAGDPLIARQVFNAPSGTYRLRTIASGEMKENGGAFEWRLFCTEAGAEIHSSTMSQNREFISEVFETELAIPSENCHFQTIELRGRAGRFPKSSRIDVSSVTLEPVMDQDSG